MNIIKGFFSHQTQNIKFRSHPRFYTNNAQKFDNSERTPIGDFPEQSTSCKFDYCKFNYQEFAKKMRFHTTQVTKQFPPYELLNRINELVDQVLLALKKQDINVVITLLQIISILLCVLCLVLAWCIFLIYSVII